MAENGSSGRLPAPQQQPDLRPAALQTNWLLVSGSVIVLLIFLIALAGPALAPHDPMARELIIRSGGRYISPPFPAFSPGYPLGSDYFGRDLLSRLLWAVRPTLLMVLIIGSVRLVLGVVIGLAAGWSDGRLGRAANTGISAALALPVLLVALGGIAAVGVERGIIAFIVGLALTGWADTARFIREQTQIIRQQPYIQAARALGASDLRILLLHVLRQVLPLSGMLFAFEISSTLLLTSALGFLGYYIGGGVWILVDDRVARNTTGLPELGQMLATSLIRLTAPGPMVVTGSVVFMMVLGFNMLGEGLRQQQSLERMGRRALLLTAVSRIGAHVEGAVSKAAGREPIRRTVHIVTAILFTLVLGTGVVWLRSRPATSSGADAAATAVSLEVAGRYLWAADRSDAFGTLQNRGGKFSNPKLRWSLSSGDGSAFSGGPVVAEDGMLYIATRGGRLYAFSSSGEARWQAALPAAAIGAPALGPQGDIYVVDEQAGLSAFKPDGKRRWRFQSDYGKIATSGPVVGADNTIYYAIIDAVQAVAPDGTARWRGVDPDLSYLDVSPRLSPSGDFVFLKGTAFSTQDGVRQEFTLDASEQQQFGDPAYFVGADGATYYRSGHFIILWRAAAGGAQPVQAIKWDNRKYRFYLPADAGVTSKHLAWLLYEGGPQAHLVWLDFTGRVVGAAEIRGSRVRIMGIDHDGQIYVCGSHGARALICSAYGPESAGSLWEIRLEKGGTVVGGAMIPGRLYVATEDGVLYAIDGDQP